MRFITLPLVRGGVAAAAFLLFVLSIREVAASLFLYTTRTRVLRRGFDSTSRDASSSRSASRTEP
jgi:ABC-type Fe3+ transport system permease subunit